MWVVNAVLVVLGFIFLGIRSMGWTIYSSFALSFYVSAFEWAVPLRAPLTNDVFLELCYAVILSAVGAAIVFNIGASTGGTDIVAMILNKYTSMPVGRALMVSDLGIVLAGAYLYGPATGLYCILGMILKSTVADSHHGAGPGRLHPREKVGAGYCVDPRTGTKITAVRTFTG